MHRVLTTTALLALLSAPALSLGAAEEGPAPDPKPAGEEAAAEEAKPFLGVVVRPTAESGFDGPRGLVVDRVFPRTTADELGLQRGDIITSFNGQDVSTRDGLKAILEQISVGDKVTSSYQRDGQTIKGAAVLHARPTRKSVSEDLDEAQSTITELQQQRAAQLEDLSAARSEERSLAEAMTELSQTLQELPEKLDLTARQFKAVYPDGEFTVDITIRISSHPQDGNAINLSPSLPPPSQPEQDASKDAAPAESEIEAEAEAEANDLLPPPTKPITPE